MLVTYMDALKIADIDTKVDGVKLKIKDIQPHDFDCSNCAEISLQPGGDLQLAIRDFDIRVQSHVDAHYIITAGAHCDSKLKDGTVVVGIKVDVGADGHPTLTADTVDVAIGNVDLDCDGFAGTIMDALTKVFKDKVIDQLSDAIKGAMPNAVAELSTTLGGVALDIPFDSNFAEIRFELSAAPDVEAEYVSVPVLGTVVPVANPGQVAPYPIPQIPSYDSTEDSYVQVFLSDFTMNSALYTFWAAERIKRTVMPSDIPATFPLQLNTSSLAVVAPGLTAKYPTAVPVELFAQADPLSKPDVKITAADNGAVVQMPSLLSFRPIPAAGQPAVDGFTLSCPLQGVATISITGQVVAANMSDASCNLTVFNSTVGSINVAAVDSLSELIIADFLLPAINQIANAGFSLPSVDHFKLSNGRVKVSDSYALIAADFVPA